MKYILVCALWLPALTAHGFSVSTIKWSTSTVTLNLQLGSPSATLIDGRSTWGEVAEDAANTWNLAVTKVKFAVVRNSTAPIGEHNSTNNVFFSSSVYGTAWGSRVLAITDQFYFTSTRTLAEADVIFNNTYTWNSYRGALRSEALDFQRVALHEFGHVLGLDHPDDAGQTVTAIMNSTTSDIDTLQPDDIQGVRIIYDAGVFYPAPVIVTPPASQTSLAGRSVTFSVAVTASPPLSYQWKKDGGPISGATSASYTIPSVQVADAGSYAVAVSNFNGTTTSAPAALTVTGVPPVITTQPANRSIDPGQAVSFSVVVTTTTTVSYQWRKNNTPISGAIEPTYSISSVVASDAGSYSVVVTNAGGSVTSAVAVLSVTAVPAVSPPSSQAITAGQAATFSVTASGAGALSYQWRKDGIAIAGATSAAFSIPNAQITDAGNYAVVVTNSGGSTTSQFATLTVTPANPARLINLSILTAIDAAGDSFTMGYVIGGDGTVGPKPVVIRAVGPSLRAFGLANALDDPRFELFSGASKTGENDNWGGSLQVASAMASVGAFAYTNANSLDAAAALIVTLRDSSVKVSAVGTGTGAVLAEIYDATPAASFAITTPRLVNVSVLKPIGAGFSAGFVIGGGGPAHVLIRAVGPTLASAFGLAGTLADPQIKLFAGSAPIAANDNWGGVPELVGAFGAVGAFPLPALSKDAALLVTLQPGSYTAQVVSGAGENGLVLVEIYEAP